MKQVFKTKEQRMLVREVPRPQAAAGQVLVLNEFSLISAGTETGGLVLPGDLRGQLRVRQDLLRKGLKAIRHNTLRDLLRKAAHVDNIAGAVGYSTAGRVLALGQGVHDLQPGDRVACAGSGIAAHAEVVAVPRLLVAPVPDDVPSRDAAWATVASIALQGIRQGAPALGETVVVTGLGLIGLLSVQMLAAAGCRVLGLDLLPGRLELARRCGAEQALLADDPGVEEAVQRLSGGVGADLVLLTAGTSSSAPLRQAMSLARKRGRVVVVGAVGLELPRSPFYEKEVELRIACSYGPGRYDPDYEQRGRDYPPAFARWTENRNLQAVLELMRSGRLRPALLEPRIYPIEQAVAAFDGIKAAPETHLAVMLEYPALAEEAPTPLPALSVSGGRLGLAVIGAGGFCARVHLPTLAALADVELRGLVSRGGFTAGKLATEFKVPWSGTDPTALLADPGTQAVLIATRHDSHAQLALRALAAGKHVFVEKPAAIRLDEIEALRQALAGSPLLFCVGYNRRFAPLARRLKAGLDAGGEPLVLSYRVNAGRIPATSWVQVRSEGGGRLIGEGCHFIDFCSFLAGAQPEEAQVRVLPARPGPGGVADQYAVTLAYPDGSLAQIQYVSEGSRGLEKERIEAHAAGASWVLEDFRRLTRHDAQGGSKSWDEADKGHAAGLQAFVRAALGQGPPPMSVEEALGASEWAIALQDWLDGDNGESPC
ncbi:MAG: bi-domain-containing oxidoreductase [Candidatus Delongbacteria bacterium]